MKVSFDLDGTLISGECRQTYLLYAIAKRFDILLDTNSIWDQKKSGKSNLEVLLDFGISRDLSEKISLLWIQEVENFYWLGLDCLFNDTIKELNKLINKNIDVELITARKNSFNLFLQLKTLRIEKFFRKIHCVSPQNAIISKTKILKMNNYSFYIGDSEIDLISAKNSNTPFFAVSSGQRSRRYLVDAGATKIADTLEEAISFYF